MGYKKCNKCQRPDCNECKPLCEYTALPAKPCEDIEYCGDGCLEIYPTDCIEFPDGTTLTEYLENFTEFVVDCCAEIEGYATEIIISSEACCDVEPPEIPICPTLSFNDTLVNEFCVPVDGDVLYLPLSAYVSNYDPTSLSIVWDEGRCDNTDEVSYTGILLNSSTGEVSVGSSAQPGIYDFSVWISRLGCDNECLDVQIVLNDCGCSLDVNDVTWDEGTSEYTVDVDYTGCPSPMFTWEAVDASGIIPGCTTPTSTGIFIVDPSCIRYFYRLVVDCGDCSETFILCDHIDADFDYVQASVNDNEDLLIELLYPFEGIQFFSWVDVNGVERIAAFLMNQAILPLPDLVNYRELCIPVTVVVPCIGPVTHWFHITPTSTPDEYQVVRAIPSDKCQTNLAECQDCSFDVVATFIDAGGCGSDTECELSGGTEVILVINNIVDPDGCLSGPVNIVIEVNLNDGGPFYVHTLEDNVTIQNNFNRTLSCLCYDSVDGATVTIRVSPVGGYTLEKVLTLNVTEATGTVTCMDRL